MKDVDVARPLVALNDVVPILIADEVILRNTLQLIQNIRYSKSPYLKIIALRKLITLDKSTGALESTPVEADVVYVLAELIKSSDKQSLLFEFAVVAISSFCINKYWAVRVSPFFLCFEC